MGTRSARGRGRALTLAVLINTRHFFGTHPSALSHFRDQQNYGIIQENVNIHVEIITFMIIWTDYLQYRAKLRGFDLAILEWIINHSTERYFDVETGRSVVIGRHHDDLVMVPYDRADGDITPVTVHVTTRQQINFRLQMERLIYE
jgi:hypothetical protein